MHVEVIDVSKTQSDVVENTKSADRRSSDSLGGKVFDNDLNLSPCKHV